MASRRVRRDETEEHDNKRSRLVGSAIEASSSQIDAESLLGAAEGLTRMVTHCGDYSSMAGTSEAREQRDAQDEPAPDKPAPFLKKLALMLRGRTYHLLAPATSYLSIYPARLLEKCAERQFYTGVRPTLVVSVTACA